ncbi:hypothetical protein T492DRAFT_1148422 [Pavlovales sp. CCMP2436]|nr:hypothetical protein T492DRAFT_1148422 [Pavlovales sp. CCMP2436]
MAALIALVEVVGDFLRQVGFDSTHRALTAELAVWEAERSDHSHSNEGEGDMEWAAIAQLEGLFSRLSATGELGGFAQPGSPQPGPHGDARAEVGAGFVPPPATPIAAGAGGASGSGSPWPLTHLHAQPSSGGLAGVEMLMALPPVKRHASCVESALAEAAALAPGGKLPVSLSRRGTPNLAAGIATPPVRENPGLPPNPHVGGEVEISDVEMREISSSSRDQPQLSLAGKAEDHACVREDAADSSLDASIGALDIAPPARAPLHVAANPIQPNPPVPTPVYHSCRGYFFREYSVRGEHPQLQRSAPPTQIIPPPHSHPPIPPPTPPPPPQAAAAAPPRSTHGAGRNPLYPGTRYRASPPTYTAIRGGFPGSHKPGGSR